MNLRQKLIAITVATLIIFSIGSIIFYKLIHISQTDANVINYSDNISGQFDLSYNHFGIPYINYKSDNDLFFAIGYTQAENRLWQMDLYKRMAIGNLSEILGVKYLSYDKFIRNFSFLDSAKTSYANLPNKVKIALDAYTDGVNFFIQENQSNLPIEYSILNKSPKIWQHEDALAVFNFLKIQTNFSLFQNLIINSISEKIGIKEFKKFINFKSSSDINSVSIVDSNQTQTSFLSDKNNITLKLLDSLSQFDFLFNPFTSLNFAIRKKINTNSFQSALAVDFSGELSMPNKLMTIITNGPSGNSSGIYLPGIPFPITNKNNNIQWSINFSNNNQFLIKKIEKDSLEKDAIKLKVDTIHIAESPSKLFYKKHLYGSPVISNEFFQDEQFYLTTNSDKLYSSLELITLHNLYYTDNIEQFTQISKNWTTPAVSFIISDRNGNIAQSSHFDYYLDNSETSLTKIEKIEINPRRNYLISNILPEDFSKDSLNFLSNICREYRVYEYLKNLTDYEIRDIKNIQLDNKSVFAQAILQIAIPIIESKSYLLNKDERKFFSLIKNWNFTFQSNLKSPIIFNIFIEKLISEIFKDELGNKLIDYIINSRLIHNNLIELLNNQSYPYFDNISTKQTENRDYLIFIAFKHSISTYQKAIISSKTNKQRFGKYFPTNFVHFADENKLIGFVFQKDTLSSKGSYYSPLFYDKNNKNFRSGNIFRGIIISNENKINSVMPLGTSGDPTSIHFNDQTQVWQNGGYFQIPQRLINTKLPRRTFLKK
jgi:penicillin amidase